MGRLDKKMDLGLKGKVAFVLGASSGLGEAVARSLAKEGANLVICARRLDRLEMIAGELEEKHGIDVLPLGCDITVKEDLINTMNIALTRFGCIDILINNSGGPPSGLFDDITDEQWENSVELLLLPFVRLTRLVLPKMKQAGWGRIINVTSVAVKQPVNGLILSNSIRAAISGFSKTLSNEVGKFGITVNNIMPGYTRTDRLKYLSKQTAKRENISIDEVFKRWESTIPLGRVAEPNEFADVVTFIASTKSSYITGASLQVDGGNVKSIL